jgi:hypothetical protein
MAEVKTVVSVSDSKPRPEGAETTGVGAQQLPTLLSLSRLASPGSVAALCIDSNVNLAFVMEPLMRSVLAGTDFYGIKVEKVGKAVVVSSQEIMHVMLQDAFSGQELQKSLTLVRPALTGGADWFLPEGRALLEKSAGKNCELLAAVVSARPRNMSLPFDQLPAVIASMRQKSGAAILAFHGLAAAEVKQLPNYFGMLLNVQACEPDRGFASAYMVAPATGTFLAGVNVSPRVDNIRLTTGGQIERESYPSHSHDPETREMVKLREEGKKLAQIALEFGVDTTTVLRRLQKLPYGHRRDRGE